MKSTVLFPVLLSLTVNSFEVEANEVSTSCGIDGVIVTELPVTVSPVPTATGIFAATGTGLIALNLQTLEATSLTSEEAFAVAVNQNLQKVYWSDYYHNWRLMRSEFNGSDQEIITPNTKGYMYSLAVHEPSGNIYFSVRYSNEITVCNALGENCAVVISSSSLANYVYSFALDSKNNAMYWSNYYAQTQTSLIRANLDGSSVTIISSGFSTSFRVAITLVEHSYDTLYWADSSGNTIGTIDVNGSNKRTLIELEGNPTPQGIQVDANKIYFGNWLAKSIQNVDRDSGKGLTTILNSPGGIRHLALFSAAD